MTDAEEQKRLELIRKKYLGYTIDYACQKLIISKIEPKLVRRKMTFTFSINEPHHIDSNEIEFHVLNNLLNELISLGNKIEDYFNAEVQFDFMGSYENWIVVISQARIVAFVDIANASQLGIVKAFQMSPS